MTIPGNTTVNLTASNGSIAALHVDTVELGAVYVGKHRADGIDGPTGTVLDGVLEPIGYVSADGITIRDEDDQPGPAWGDETLRTLQDKRDISFSFNIEHINPEVWRALYNLPRPKPAPTLRSAAVDACAALRTLLRILLATLRVALMHASWSLADWLVWPWLDPIADRWDALRRYPWRRLPGPKLHMWDKRFRYLHTEHSKPESLRKWARRCATYTWKVLRHG